MKSSNVIQITISTDMSVCPYGVRLFVRPFITNCFSPNQQMLQIISPQDHPRPPGSTPGIISGERGQAFTRKCLRSGHFIEIYNTILTVTYVCPSFVLRPYVTKIFFRLNCLGITLGSPPTPGVDPSPRPPGHAAPPEELAQDRRALSSMN